VKIGASNKIKDVRYFIEKVAFALYIIGRDRCNAYCSVEHFWAVI